MSEQDGTQPATKSRKSRQTSKQNGTQKTTLQWPKNDDKETWQAYWKAQGQPWRTEPEIDAERQQYLDKRRRIEPDIDQGIYPFKDIKLSRADVEWLLATHENGRGPVDWSDESQRERKGLDLRGADLRNEDLRGLPLAKLRSGITEHDWFDVAEEQHAIAAVKMEGTNLSGAQLQGADLRSARLQAADLCEAQLGGADLYEAQLGGADLSEAQLQGASLIRAQLESADLTNAQLQGASLGGAQLQGASLMNAQLQGASLMEARLAGANLGLAQLQGASLYGAQLQGARLSGAQLQGADLRMAQLQGTDLRDVFLAAESHHIGPQFADIQWGDTNLAVVDWEQITMLGDECVAAQKLDPEGEKKGKDEYLEDYKEAARAYRQLSVVLRNQGLNEDATRFAYRAQLMQCKVFWYRRKFLQYLGSLFLYLLSGYGYKVGRCFIAYALVIGIFATIYHLLGTHPTWNESIVISMTAFHGRGFFPDQFHPGDPQALTAAIEAFVGLLIEVTFIAALTQRLFGK